MADRTYSDTAQALASQMDDDSNQNEHGLKTSFPNARNQPSSSSSPSWRRRSVSQPADSRPMWMRSVETVQRKALRIWNSFTPLQRVGIIALDVVLILVVVLGIAYNHRIFAFLAPYAKRWHDMPAGWLILWAMTFFVSFPPMIGYATCVTIAGFVFGMKGWLIVSTATVLGSTASFIVSRTVLKSFVGRLTEKNKQFQALSLVLKHDGVKLLVMIRLCPLPYSLSNGAISTIPSVTWQNFMLANALASPKLLLHVFVGSQLGDIAQNGDKMSSTAKTVSYVSIFIGAVAGIGTGYWVYVRTKARAAQLEAEDEAARSDLGRSRSGDAPANGYDDEDGSRQARRGHGDDISLHQTYDEDVEAGGGTYRDEFTDDEDAHEHDVFDDGDLDDEDAWKGARR